MRRKSGNLLPIENCLALQYMRKLKLSDNIVNTFKNNKQVLKTAYYNLQYITEQEADDLDKLIISKLEKKGRIVFHIFHSRGIVTYAPDKKEVMIKRAYTFVNKMKSDMYHPTGDSKVEHGVVDAFIIDEPISNESKAIFTGGGFASINLSEILDLKSKRQVIWSIENV